MIFDLEKLAEKYSLNIKGVIHIGAHNGGEFPVYQKLGIEYMLFFEPLAEAFSKLQSRVKGMAVNLALGNYNGNGTMHVADNGQSSSLLEPHIHKFQYPDIKFDKLQEVKIKKLDDYLPDIYPYNFINIDVQGYELEVFAGASKTLGNIDYIITEVNNDELYRNCARVGQVDSFLSYYGFKRVETAWAAINWGDAFYMK